MSDDQLRALLTKLEADAGLRDKLKGCADFGAAIAMAQDAGFDVTRADWLRHQAQNKIELSDEELEDVTGGTFLYTMN
jgi:predicted ribosomally synthesized peptide with nif11-like leader